MRRTFPSKIIWRSNAVDQVVGSGTHPRPQHLGQYLVRSPNLLGDPGSLASPVLQRDVHGQMPIVGYQPPTSLAEFVALDGVLAGHGMRPRGISSHSNPWRRGTLRRGLLGTPGVSSSS